MNRNSLPASLPTNQVDLTSDLTNFGIGQPGFDILPHSELQQAAAHRMADPGTTYLNYGFDQGDGYCRVALADFLTRHYDHPTTHDDLFLTGGNSQALDMVCTHFTKPGDTVFVEDPTYFLAFKIFHDHHLNIVSIPIDDDGLRIDLLEDALDKHKPTFVYTIPAYHNPTGICLSAERRQQLIQLSQQHNFLIVADEVYQLLHYADPPPPAFGTHTDSDTILSLGTFSKILAPGLRLGWIQTTADKIAKLSDAGYVYSGGSVSHFTSGIVRSALELGLVDGYLARLRQLYSARIAVMADVIQTQFPQTIHAPTPTGGYFFWLRLPENVHVETIRQTAIQQKIAFHTGDKFSADNNHQHYIRLAFSYYPDHILKTGLETLAPILTEACR